MASTVQFQRPATVLIDVHNGCFIEGGPFYFPRAQLILDPLKEYLKESRALGIPVIYVTYQTRTNLTDTHNPFWEGGEILEFYPDVGKHVEGSSWAEVYHELEPEPGDTRINTKRRYSAFYGTDLELVLRGLKADTVVLGGFITEVCILCTAFEAFNRDYKVVVLKDCTASYKEESEAFALETVAREMGWVMTAREFLSRVASAGDLLSSP